MFYGRLRKTFFRIASVTTFVLAGFVYFPIKRIDPALKGYYDYYQELKNEVCPSLKLYKPAKIIIDFGMKSGPYIGICYRSNIGFHITVDRQWWDHEDEQDRFQLMMHELSHCMLGLDHIEDPSNYMYPSFMYLDKDTVIQELTANFKAQCPSK